MVLRKSPEIVIGHVLSVVIVEECAERGDAAKEASKLVQHSTTTATALLEETLVGERALTRSADVMAAVPQRRRPPLQWSWQLRPRASH